MADFYIPWGGNLPRLFIDRNGDVMGGATLSAYKARTTTPINMYDGINGDVIGDEVVVSSDGDGQGYVERDEVSLTSADTVVDILGTDTEGNAGTASVELEAGVYFGARDMTAYERTLSTQLYQVDKSNFTNILGLAASNGYAYVADINEKLRRIKPNGSIAWTYNFTTQLTQTSDQIAADPSGNAYIIQGADVLKISAAGSLVWTYVSGLDGGTSSVTASDTDTWLVANTGDSPGDDGVIDRVDSDGNQVWRSVLSEQVGSGANIALDSALNAYAVSGTFIQSIDASGNSRWSVSTSTVSPNGCAVSADDAFLFISRSNDTLEKRDTTDGSLIDTYNETRNLVNMALGGDGFIYIIVGTGQQAAQGRKIDPSDMTVVTSVTLDETGGEKIAADPGGHPSFYS